MANTPYPLPRQTRESTVLQGNGTVGPYGPSTFKIFDTADVEVLTRLDGEDFFTDVTDQVTVTKTAGAAYDTFSITFGAAVLASTDFVYRAARTHERSVAVTRAGTIDSDQLEKELSKQGTVISELRRDVDRNLSFQPDFDGEATLPRPAADQFLGWDSTGEKLENKLYQALGDVQVINENDLASNSPDKVPTQRSVKTYADARVAAEAARATAAEGTLSSAIAAEAVRATAAEGAEASRAIAAEGSLSSQISAEVIRATAAETNLGSLVVGASSGLRAAPTWALLAAITGTAQGQPGRVTGVDAGTHTDPVVSGTVANTGEYAWSTSPAGWRRLGALTDVVRGEAFMQRGHVAADTSLNTLVTPGFYLGASTGYTMTPTGFTGSFFLTVETPGPASGLGATKYVKQTLFAFAATGAYRRWWVRIVDVASPPATDTWADMNTVYPANLHTNFNYRGAIGGTDLNAVVASGNYVVTSGMANAPSGAMVGALVRVETHGSFIVQTYCSLTDPTIGWTRVIFGGVPGSWVTLPGSSGGGGFGGKTIVAFGDSITENGDYPARLASKTGATVINGGFGGCRMAVHNHATIGVYYDPMSMYRLAGYMKNGNWSALTTAADALFAHNADDNRANAAALAATTWANVNIAVIFFGTNDFGADIPIGSASDTTGATFKGAINRTILDIMSAYPHIKLMFVTPMWKATGETPNANGVVLTAFVDAIIERAAAYNIEVLDMYRNGGINSLNSTTYLADGTHPKAGFGYQHVADKIGAALASRF